MLKKISSVLCVFVIAFSFLSATAIAKKEEKKKDLSLQEKMDGMMVSAAGWSDLKVDEKKQAVGLIVDLYKVRENSAILKPSDFYVSKIDENLAKDASMATLGLPGIIKVLAVMEYDYYNGQNKEELAQKVLGPQLYDENRKKRAREAGIPGV